MAQDRSTASDTPVTTGVAATTDGISEDVVRALHEVADDVFMATDETDLPAMIRAVLARLRSDPDLAAKALGGEVATRVNVNGALSWRSEAAARRDASHDEDASVLVQTVILGPWRDARA